jgi:hypothetical protein
MRGRNSIAAITLATLSLAMAGTPTGRRVPL